MLFERGVVLFIDDDDAQVGNRSEHRRARAKDDPRVPAERLAPRTSRSWSVSAECRHRQRDRRIDRETVQRAAASGRSLAPARARAALLEHTLDEAQVDLGFAAARDAVKHERAKAPKRLADGLDGGPLLLTQLGRLR